MPEYLFKPKKTQQTDGFPEKTLTLLNDAKQTVRAWIRQTFKGRLLNNSYLTLSATSFTKEIEVSRISMIIQNGRFPLNLYSLL